MPTPEDIKNMATEIADTLYNEDRTYNHHLWWSVEPKERKAEEVEDIISVILRDYCIVEKSKVREEYNYYKNSWNETELTETTMESFETLFGKSLFNEEKE